MDRIKTTQLRKLSGGEYFQARRSTGETTNLRTIESSQPDKPIRRDLRNQGVSCFFDEDRESLPLGEDFPSRIFEAAKTCKISPAGIPGQGKTTVGKAFCNFKLVDFEGKVCHLEFSEGAAFDRTKIALQHLTHCPQWNLHTSVDQDQAQVEFYRRVKGQRVLLVLNDITEESIDEVTYYLKADLGESSCILLSAGSIEVLVKHFNIKLQSCKRLPRLEEDEAIRILLQRTRVQESTLRAEEKAFAAMCADRCSFKEVGRRGRTFHPSTNTVRICRNGLLR
ncbi:hypothetical protein SUGI_0876340 [Cryptomeria japonica]|nr:hypothetical protein SUGI_0876340 [Cryptomeria japonica]